MCVLSGSIVACVIITCVIMLEITTLPQAIADSLPQY